MKAVYCEYFTMQCLKNEQQCFIIMPDACKVDHVEI